MNLKYIIVEHEGKQIPIVFSPLLSHAHVAGNSEVQSAGYCDRDTNGNWIAAGRSDSLNMKARIQDSKILREHLF
jgi:hypothetical protein